VPSPLDAPHCPCYRKWHDVGCGIGGHKKWKYKKKWEKRVSNKKYVSGCINGMPPSLPKVVPLVLWHLIPLASGMLRHVVGGKRMGKWKRKTYVARENKNNNQCVWLIVKRGKTISNQHTCGAWPPGIATTTTTTTISTKTKEHRTKTIFLPPVHEQKTSVVRSAMVRVPCLHHQYQYQALITL